ncbi:DUF1254 domain-containing protein [Aquisphaera insulae]|uniref:DUF1254 domain-containing protein n=1 Tax=Aquisphaera insulae TaxID=2712864 RepID=UPI00196B2005|nr:DUF1254 domain-containing protein [Aquisphaera insulae]
MTVPSLARPDAPGGEVQAIAEEAFIYGFPMVMNYGTMYEYAIDISSSQYKAPFNRVYNTARVFTPRDTAIVTPNSDTPYSFLWMDLRAEPVVLTVPKIEKGRYFSVQLIDLYTHNYGYLGTRITGNEGGRYLVAGPSWHGETPKGIDGLIRCETEFSLAGYRTQLFGPGDLDNVKAIQAGYRAQTLSGFLGTPAPAAPPGIEWPKIDKGLAATDPFRYLNLVLSFCPTVGTAEVERPLRQRLARIGIEPGKPFTTDHLTPDQKAGLVAGMKSGLEKIKARLAGFGTEVNGWRIGSAFGDRDFYKGDWALRAAAAMGGIYGNNATEAVYPILAADSEGHKPDCSKARYALTFPKDQFPPANAFWSVTMYDARTQLLVENPIGRFLINSPMLARMKTNEDGSLTISIQRDSPGKDGESNWLPAPDGPIYVVMRVYWPRREALDGTWKPPAVVPVK